MRIIFFGTGDFAIPTLRKLLHSGNEIQCVVTQPDSRRGRGWNLLPSPVKAFAEKAAPGIPILQPVSASEEEFLSGIRSKKPDLIVVVDYGQFLKKALLEIPSMECVNLHPSILPKYRGAAPVNWAILNGETRTGVTVFRMSARMDAGDILFADELDIRENEKASDLLDRLSQKGADLIVGSLEKISSGRVTPKPQDEKAATFAPKLAKNDGEIDWKDGAERILRLVRAMDPWPSSWTRIEGRSLKILDASMADGGGSDSIPGTVTSEYPLIVKTGDNKGILINTLQMEGKKQMSAEEFIRGYGDIQWMVLGSQTVS
ncbi:MAG: methionyl-tRNA formyltransferase [Candidatus Omnitrophica bacterium]|nr:methionyl-tRNA formyltransferase [Candidatus Omnitrophota bacterium]